MADNNQIINANNNFSPSEATDNDVNKIIQTVDSILRKEYLPELSKADIVPLRGKLRALNAGENIRIFDITSFAYSPESDIYSSVMNLFSSVADFNASPLMIVDSDGSRVKLYLGLSVTDCDTLSTSFNTFKASFDGNFQGGKISMLNVRKNEQLLSEIFGEEGVSISSVTSLSTANDSEKMKDGIEKLVNSMHGTPFTMILLSQSVQKQQIALLRQNMEMMYTQLSPLRSQDISMNENESQSLSRSVNLTTNESVSTSTNKSKSMSLNESTTTPDQQEEDKKRLAKNQLLGTAASVALMAAGTFIPGMGMFASQGNMLQGLFYGSQISNVFGSAQTLLNGNAPIGPSKTDGKTVSFSESETSSVQKGFSESKGLTDGNTYGSGRTLGLKYENRSVIGLLDTIDKQITRLQHLEGIGGYNCAAYFITGDNSTALTVANTYRSLIGGGDSLGQMSAINVWNESSKVTAISQYLTRMLHPVFRIKDNNNYPEMTASCLISSDELPVYAAFPRKSMPGLTVTSHAEFARDVIKMSGDSSEELEIGNIYHMGRIEETPVTISKNDLNGHMFVAGSTGMGKSNFCYGLLGGLYKSGVKFMVIEPAKGEYSRVFGGYDDVNVYGTNPNLMPLLQINPFSFPEGIHVNEHIDRIVDIFNSCWPMYAAMPAVLKESIETIYKNCGYNLVTGRTKNKGVFPSFKDLLDIMPVVVKKSEFSGEVQGNYIGSLVTRVKSLTTGLYGCIFTKNEIDNKTLFDENTLIDLSRVGSGETKALIMGMLVTKLQEYRMSSGRMNTSLFHVTLLEEAHHLLKGSSSSSAEGVNLRAMSLEMITNAIAEMRTYGEGFVIADQSPAIMDLSVIRNTNTKVMFKLPEMSDRQVMGNAMSLNNDQIKEISKLERGVAVIYQSNWDDAVLSKIHLYDESNFRPYKHTEEFNIVEDSDVISQSVAIALRGRLENKEDSSVDTELCKEIIKDSIYIDNDLQELTEIIEEHLNGGNEMDLGEISSCIIKTVNINELFKSAGKTDSISDWEVNAMNYIDKQMNLTYAEKRELLLICLTIASNKSESFRKLYFRYLAYSKKEKLLKKNKE